jgi:hypothetical protein
LLARQWRRAEPAGSTCAVQVVHFAVVLPGIEVVWARALETVFVVPGESRFSAESCISVRKSWDMAVRNTDLV